MTEQQASGVVHDQELEEYVRGVTDRLGPVPDRDELVDELRAHLIEVRADAGGRSLVDVLGTPQAYADEMLSASGLPAYSAGRASAITWAAARFRGVRENAPTFLMDLRAFWWGVRGLALGLMVWVLVQTVPVAFSYNDYVGSWNYLLSVNNATSTIVGRWGWAESQSLLVALLLVGPLVSVWAGGRLARGHGPRWLAALVGVVGVLLGIWLMFVCWDLLTAGVFAQILAVDPSVQSSGQPAP